MLLFAAQFRFAILQLVQIIICLVYCLKNNKRAIAKVQKNSNRHGGKNVTIQNDSTGDITN